MIYGLLDFNQVEPTLATVANEDKLYEMKNKLPSFVSYMKYHI